MTEVRTVSETGGEKGSKPGRFDLIPARPLFELAEHFGRGSEKYEDRNWERGYRWSLSFAALMRHAWQFWGGEDMDPETGSKHMVAVAWHALALAEFMDTHPEFDDRVKPKSTLATFSTFIEKEFEPTEAELVIQPRTMTMEFKTLDRDPDTMATLFNVDARSIDQAIERGEARAEARQRQGFIGR